MDFDGFLDREKTTCWRRRMWTQLCLHSLLLWENMGLIYDMIKKTECEQHSQLECYREHGLRELRFRKTGKQQIGVSSLITWHATPGKGNDATRSIEPIAAHLVRQSASIPEAIVGLARPEDDQNPEKNSGSTAFATRSSAVCRLKNRDL